MLLLLADDGFVRMFANIFHLEMDFDILILLIVEWLKYFIGSELKILKHENRFEHFTFYIFITGNSDLHLKVIAIIFT